MCVPVRREAGGGQELVDLVKYSQGEAGNFSRFSQDPGKSV